MNAPSEEQDITETQHWSVSVERNGKRIVTIESNFLSGRQISEEDERIIRLAAQHLNGFVGPDNTAIKPSEPVARIKSGCTIESTDRVRSTQTILTHVPATPVKS